LGAQIKEDEIGRDLAHMEEKRKEYKIMVVKTEASDGRVILKCILKK
jgi:hypothetical protein